MKNLPIWDRCCIVLNLRDNHRILSSWHAETAHLFLHFSATGTPAATSIWFVPERHQSNLNLLSCAVKSGALNKDIFTGSKPAWDSIPIYSVIKCFKSQHHISSDILFNSINRANSEELLKTSDAQTKGHKPIHQSTWTRPNVTRLTRFSGFNRSSR